MGHTCPMEAQRADGKRIWAICDRKVMSLQNLSDLSGVAYRTVKSAAAGNRCAGLTLNALAQALEVPVSEIVVAAVAPAATR